MSKSKLSTKGRRDKVRAQRRLSTIKRLSARPVYKKPDDAAIRASFEAASATKPVE